MGRAKKPRTCSCPFEGKRHRIYKPAGTPTTQLQRISLFEDELEALRLCDVEGLTQEEAGAKMGISRGTVQRLLASGRKKMISALLESKALFIGPDHETV